MAGADISLTYDDCPDDLTDEGFEQGDCSTSRTPGDDASLTPLLRVQKYAQSGDVFDRHWVPRVVQDIFRTAPANVLTKELPEIMKVLSKVADDSLLKADLLENIPDIAAQAIENSERVAVLKDVIGDYLIPLVIRNLGSNDTGVEQKAQASLIQMVEKGYISKFQAEIKICPSLLALTKMQDRLDVNSGVVTLMNKLGPLLGRDITERILLKRYTDLCNSSLFYIRKQSISQIGYYCVVLGKEAFENILLPCYLEICRDPIWGVRKACADVVMYLSCVCTPELRKNVLAPVFAKLLNDGSRWVRMSAFQTLGAFISTFADPPLTSIGYSSTGEIVMFNQNGNEFHPGSIEVDGHCVPGTVCLNEELLSLSDLIGVYENPRPDRVTDLDDVQSCPIKTVGTKTDIEENSQEKSEDTNTNSDESILAEDSSMNNDVFLKVKESDANTGAQPNDFTTREESKETDGEIWTGKEIKHEDDLLSYNEYNYWYISPPDVKLDDFLDDSDTGHCEILNDSSEDIVTNHLEELYATISLNDSSISDDRQNESIQPNSDNKGDNLDNNSSEVSTVNSITTIELKEPPQKIVPQDLIDCFVSMARGDSQFSDNDMSFHCAYSLPAVVLTLGKENWPLLKDSLDVLAGHMSYKIRRTVASSLHEIAVILGPELATEHLSPLFEGFLKDLDEVRIGILKNLALFLRLIAPEKRIMFLPKLGEFMRVDNVCNWRFQVKLAEQLADCVQLFQPGEVVKHLGLYAQALMLYNVAAVRQSSITLVTEIVRKISRDHGLTSSYLSVIAERFAHSKKWKPRQTFAVLCTEIMKQRAIDSERFAMILLPHLLDLSWDPVANVRLVVANCIVKQIVKRDYFMDPENEHIESLSNVLRRLQADKDRDVRMAADLPLL